MQETLIPSALAHHVKENVISYLKTTFNIKNDGFAKNFEEHIRSDNGLFKGPYVDIKLPFKAASTFPTDLLDFKPLFRPFEHQVQAFRRITSKGKDPQNTLVVTGTGSGKTECFLIPALDHCARNKSKTGIKVIILYPMNALAFDQARRIGEMIFEYPELKGVTAGILVGEDYDGQEKRISHKHMASPNFIIDDRKTIIQNPPDILLTNYKMLDNLLMKPEFKSLWEGAIGEDSSVQYLILDEMHTYDGAQGADVALLIRRLKAKLSVDSLTCVGTSATLSSDSDGTEILKRFAHRLFGEDFETESIIRESRKTLDEVFSLPVKYSKLPHDLNNLSFEDHKDIKKFVNVLSEKWFGEVLEGNALGVALLTHKITRTILECLDGKPLPEKELLEKLSKKDIQVTPELLSSFLALLAHATSEVEFNGKKRVVPLFFCRVQLWIREMRRLLSNLEWENPKFKWIDEIKAKNSENFLPPIYCEECGEHGYLTALKDDSFVWDIMSIYEQYAEATKNVRYLFPWRDEFHIDGEMTQLSKRNICPQCGYFENQNNVGTIAHEKCPSCSHTWSAFKIHHSLSQEKKKDKRQCPSCLTNNSLRLLASRSTTISSIVNGQIFLSKINPKYSKRLLVFSDSVQDASHRAGYFNARTYRFNFRTAVQSFLEKQKEDINLLETVEPFWNYWVKELGEKKAIATFTPSDLMLLPEYDLCLEGKDKTFIPILKERLLWEFYLEFSLRSQVGRTLEKTGSSAVYLPIGEVKIAIKEIFEKLQEHYIYVREAKLSGFEHYVLGIIERSLTRGAISFEFFEKYRQKESAWELDKKYYPWISKLPKGSLDGSEVGALPKFIKTSDVLGSIFDYCGAPEQGESWFSYWYKRNFPNNHHFDRVEILKVNKEILDLLSAKGILNKVSGKAEISNYGFSPTKLKITKHISTLLCNHCAHKIVIPENELKFYQNMGCVITRCKGFYDKEVNVNSTFYQDIYKSGDVERIFASEHTGLLGRKRREEIEVEFKESSEEKRRPDSINLLSCTPTLEMGIDIGDLSATVVASLPPTASNYQQQIGRAGRKTGSALVVSVAQSRPRDLLYFRFPEELIIGNIQPPGCFLDAPDILKRQFFAFILDQRYSILFKGINSPKVDWLIEEARKINSDGFGSRMKKLLTKEGKELVELFKSEFNEKDITSETWGEIQLEFLLGSDNECPFLQRLFSEISEFDRDKSDLYRSRGEIEAKIKIYKEKEDQGGVLSEEESENLKELKREEASLIGQLDLIGARSGFFEFLTHRGFLPNYAFQEDNIELVGMILDRGKSKIQEKPQVRFKETFDRPAKMGLRELAPFNTFYGGGFKLEINQIDVGGNTKPLIEDWRACRNCGFLERVISDERVTGGCPKCGDPNWSDNGQKAKMLKFQRAVAVADAYNAHISDDAEDRQRQFFKVRPYFEISKNSRREAWAYNKSADFVFGLEFIDSLVLREINFGSEELVRAEKLQIGGEELPAGFHICTSCGRVAKPHSEKGWDIKHTMSCRFAKATTTPEKKAKLPEDKPILLYRELQSEGIRLLLPVSDFEGDVRTASIKASIMLGFIKKFGGRPMHLEISEQKIIEDSSDDSSKRFLILFDSVPGGTGFLRELWSKESFFEVIKMAKKVLDDCSCKDSQELDGCPRCILAGASQYEYPLISRKEGIKYLDEILKHQDGMDLVHGGLDSVDVSSFLDSELEYKFLNIIQNLKTETYSKILANQYIKVEELKVTNDIRDGVVFTLSKDNVSVSYKMTFQKTLNEGDRATRVDFYFKPIGNSTGLPIAMYLDGFKYHAGRISKDQLEKDFLKRQALLNGDGVNKHAVWLLSWSDIDSFVKEIGGPKDYIGLDKNLHPFLGKNSLAQFFEFLFINSFDSKLSMKTKGEILVPILRSGSKFYDMSLIQSFKDLSVTTGLVERSIHLIANSSSDTGFQTWSAKGERFVTTISVDQNNKKFISFIGFESLLKDRFDEDSFNETWNELLRTFNIFQMLSDEIICKIWAEKEH